MLLHFGGFSASGYSVHAAMSYYGEEVSGVSLIQESDFRASIDVMLSLPTDIEKIVHILSLEYGHIADIIKQCRHAHLESLRFDVIDASQGAMMLKRQNSYAYPLDDNSVMGIVFNGVLIDGNHRRLYRLSNPESFKKMVAKYIVLR